MIARTQLLYGEWLRRQGERRSARTELDAALEIFEKYGAAPWAERLVVKLRASGAVLRSRPQAGLTEAECGLRFLRLMGSPIGRSAASFTSARKRWSFISAVCIGSWACAVVPNWPADCLATIEDLLACQQVTDRRYQFGRDAEVAEVVVKGEACIGNDLSGVASIDHVARLGRVIRGGSPVPASRTYAAFAKAPRRFACVAANVGEHRSAAGQARHTATTQAIVSVWLNLAG